MSFKSGYITLIGVPNAGKSSLVNALVKESVSIVTAKPQTTRKRTLGILTQPNEYQMIFIDTPGVIESEQGLNPFLRRELTEAMKDVDVVVCAIAPWEFKSGDRPWSVKLAESLPQIPIFVITQSDRLNKGEEEKIIEKFNGWFKEKSPALYFTSSRSGRGLKELKDLILEKLKEGPQYYDAETFTPQTMREISSEVIRKYCFELLHQELPYGLAVLVQSFHEGPTLKISADILLARESHKPMVIGRGGATLKDIGTRARTELEKIFGQKVFLKLHVVVKTGWIKDKSYLQELGYEVP